MNEQGTQVDNSASQGTTPQDGTTQQDNLQSRLNQFKPSEQTTTTSSSEFNINDLDNAIDAITDDKVKGQMQNLKKSLVKGENEKYQELAKLRRQYETGLSDQTNWTTDKVLALTRDPKFVEMAQQVAVSQAGNNDSMLSEDDQRKFKAIEDGQRALQQQNQNLLRQQQDATLTGKYANYAPDVVDTFQKKLVTQEYQAGREDIWKVIDYEPLGKRAYKMGYDDGANARKERQGASSFEGTTTVSSTEGPQLEEKDKGMRAWQKIINFRMNEAKQGTQLRK